MNILTWIMLFLNNKTLIAALGLFALSFYDLTTAQYGTAWQNLLAGLGLLGIHVGMGKQSRELRSIHNDHLYLLNIQDQNERKATCG